MKNQFKQFNENIRLTETQEKDAQTKVNDVCRKLHDRYYTNDYSGTSRVIFGSYRTRTNTRPLTENQDVDVLFKIPEEVFHRFDDYDTNGQSALLYEIRKILEERYTTSEKPKAWGKVVLVRFAEGKHNVEILPGFELDNGQFMIPNTSDGGSWEIFDPRKQIHEFQESNKRTKGLTADLTRMIKTWIRNTPSVKRHYSSYEVMSDVINFLRSEFVNGGRYDDYPEIIKNFFDSQRTFGKGEIQSQFTKAFNRSIKAIEYGDDDMPKEASEEWIKIFGANVFPKVKENPKVERALSGATVIINPSSPWAK